MNLDISICMSIDTKTGIQYPHTNISMEHQLGLLDFIITNYLRHYSSGRVYIALYVYANSKQIFRANSDITAGKSMGELDEVAGKLWIDILNTIQELAKV